MVRSTHGGQAGAEISLDPDLLKRIDAAPDAKRLGRSGFVRKVMEEHFREVRRRQIDDEIRRAFAKPGVRESLADEVREFEGVGVWLDE